MKFLCTILFILVIHIGYAQSDPVAEYNRHIASNWNGKYFQIGPYKVKGSPFLFGQSFDGIIHLANGRTVNGKVLYDIYSNKAGINVNEELSELNVEISNFRIALPSYIGGQQLIFRNTKDYKNVDVQGFFNVLAEGKKISFLKYFKNKVVTDPVNAMDREAKIFEQSYEYYIYNHLKNELRQVKLREKDFIQAADNSIFKDLMKSTGTDLSQEANAIKLVNNYNLL